MTEIEYDVLKAKYLADGERMPEDMWHRVAGAVGSVEDDLKVLYQKMFYGLLEDWKFVPGGRIMHGAGREEAKRKPSLSNCYVIPITEDSLEGIYKCLSESAMVYRTGGGVGTDLSILRPKGASVNATIDASPGVTAFMNLFSESTNTVSQAGRRGALMLTLRVDHPDIEEFIRIKSDAGRTQVKHANISVLLTDEFMAAVEKKTSFDLRWRGRLFRTVDARALWDTIISLAHATAEPGLIFWDRMKAYHNVEYVNPLESTNPCGEQPLASYTACNLGNMNVSQYVGADGKFFDRTEFCRDVATAVRFLDNVITYNEKNHALSQLTNSVNKDRRVGLGITGLADALMKLELKYDSDEAIAFVDNLMNIMRDKAYQTSVQLAMERGAFPVFDNEKIFDSLFIQSLPENIQEEIRNHGLRNSTLLTCPPVGTGSIVAQCSSGIEPIFATSYNRRVKQDDGVTFRDYKVYHPLIKDLFGGDEELPDYVVTAHEIDPFFRVKMQATIQKYVDTSISSTINLPEEVSLETVSNIYQEAYKQGLKGVTVYREGSREGVLQTETYAEGKEKAAYIKPRKRPDVTRGTTERIETGEGKLYVTVNEDDEGISEVFATIGKAGGHSQSQSEALCRLISLGLRSGVDIDEVIDALKGIGGPMPIWSDGEQILSLPDGIGRALERYLEREKGVKKKEEKKMMAMDCPECGAHLAHQMGCETCLDCGYSRCG